MAWQRIKIKVIGLVLIAVSIVIVSLSFAIIFLNLQITFGSFKISDIFIKIINFSIILGVSIYVAYVGYLMISSNYERRKD
ncbi:hypothetical protein SUSAZ_03415 [Sulfolobus acidocaldarius SUSAZ]|nr:hypothetical protein SUSAZ_03415 [Sulfolobus acidocaldarius SUSAZ]